MTDFEDYCKAVELDLHMAQAEAEWENRWTFPNIPITPEEDEAWKLKTTSP